jgi:lysophospholipase L1-like esterase
MLAVPCWAVNFTAWFTCADCPVLCTIDPALRKPRKTTTVTCVGDSITAGYLNDDMVRKKATCYVGQCPGAGGYPAQLQVELGGWLQGQVDYRGNDLPPCGATGCTMPPGKDSHADCEALCRADPRCVVYTHLPWVDGPAHSFGWCNNHSVARCWTKSALDGPVPYAYCRPDGGAANRFRFSKVVGAPGAAGDWKVLNFGQSGATMLQYPGTKLHPGNTYWNSTAYQIRSNADVVVLMLGTNDAVNATGFWDPTPPEYGRFVPDYLAMIRMFQGMPSRPKILLAIPPPLFTDGVYGGHMASVINGVFPTLIPHIAGLAGLPPPIDVFALFKAHCGCANPACDWMAPAVNVSASRPAHSDGCHPDSLGYAQIAKLVAAHLTAMRSSAASTVVSEVALAPPRHRKLRNAEQDRKVLIGAQASRRLEKEKQYCTIAAS